MTIFREVLTSVDKLLAGQADWKVHGEVKCWTSLLTTHFEGEAQRKLHNHPYTE